MNNKRLKYLYGNQLSLFLSRRNYADLSLDILNLPFDLKRFPFFGGRASLGHSCWGHSWKVNNWAYLSTWLTNFRLNSGELRQRHVKLCVLLTWKQTCSNYIKYFSLFSFIPIKSAHIMPMTKVRQTVRAHFIQEIEISDTVWTLKEESAHKICGYVKEKTASWVGWSGV